MSDWAKILNNKGNKEKLKKLNLPSYMSNQKIMILDKYCPYSLDKIIDIKPNKPYKDGYGIHGTWAG